MVDKLGPYELNTIVTGDARLLAEAIPDESVDLIFTDPVYQNIDDYRWLAETAARVLKQDGNLLAFYAQQYLPATIAALDIDDLDYWYQLVVYIISGPSSRIWMGMAKYCPCLWFVPKSKVRKQHETIDVVASKAGSAKKGHKWQKSFEASWRWIRDISKDNSIVLDPFTGSGTVPAVCKMLGRQYLAFEIDPATAALARQRVANTQPPLFTLQPEQTNLWET